MLIAKLLLQMVLMNGVVYSGIDPFCGTNPVDGFRHTQNGNKSNKPGKPDKPDKPDKPEKPEKPGKGEPVEVPCRLDIDIYPPAAQGARPAPIPENREDTVGAQTLVNNDIDAAGAALLARLQQANNLNQVTARNDLVVAPIPAENDLVRIDLKNPDNLQPVFLNAYAFARDNGRVVKKRGKTQSPIRNQTDIRLWRNATKAGQPIRLPYQMIGAAETLYVEGLKAGRYRLALFHLPGVNRQKARRVKATFTGNPMLSPAPGNFSLELQERVNGRKKKTPVACLDHVRLTIALVDISQPGRPDVYDFLWGGRPVVSGRLWPRGGNYIWSQNAGLAGQWVNGNVHGQAVTNAGAIAVGRNRQTIANIRSAFAHDLTLTAVGAVAAGSASFYAERWILTYQVEGVTHVRAEPTTLMVPRTVTVGQLPNTPFPTAGRIVRGRTNNFNFGVRYLISEQLGRRLVGPGNVQTYKRRYGSEYKVYEALGPRVNAQERGDTLFSFFNSRSRNLAVRRARSYRFRVTTAQRSNAFDEPSLRTNGSFSDFFTYNINNRQRNGLQQEIRGGLLAPNAIIFDVAQDIVSLLDNGNATYDLLLASGNRLQIFAPQLGPGNVLGPIGFRFNLGAGGGTRLATNNPLRLPNNHNP